MICVTVEIREGALADRARVTAPSIERALEIMEERKPGRRMRLLLPLLQQLVEDKLLQNEAFFVPGDHGRREAA